MQGPEVGRNSCIGETESRLVVQGLESDREVYELGLVL